MTTRENEEQHRVGINIKLLPNTIADAVALCRNIGIQYLWVDALCILQDHDSAEWNDEANNMDKIYSFAAFTLAINSSADSNEGFRYSKTKVPQRRASSDATLAYNILRPGPKSLQEARNKSPLDCRGWAFQEERLSPRILHWTANGAFWSCLTGSCSEFGANNMPYKPGKTSTFFEDFSEPFYQETEEGVEKITHIDRTWSRLIEAYSIRQFQRMDDRLPALSGLARKYAARNHLQSPGDRYFAGHWLSSLHSSLLWVIGINSFSDMNTITRLTIGPWGLGFLSHQQ
jgi:hypothetical protein